MRVAVCQVPDIREDIEASLNWIRKFSAEAEAGQVSLICFPECFLQGYLTEKIHADKHAIDLSSTSLFRQLSAYKPVIVLGMIEKEKDLLFNTAVVIKQGKLIGKYRKTHLLDGEKIFTAGTAYPVFEIDDTRIGISICYDTQFAESTAELKKQGARLILCPSNNMMRYRTAEKYKHLHHAVRIERARENGV